MRRRLREAALAAAASFLQPTEPAQPRDQQVEVSNTQAVDSSDLYTTEEAPAPIVVKRERPSNVGQEARTSDLKVNTGVLLEGGLVNKETEANEPLSFAALALKSRIDEGGPGLEHIKAKAKNGALYIYNYWQEYGSEISSVDGLPVELPYAELLKSGDNELTLNIYGLDGKSSVVIPDNQLDMQKILNSLTDKMPGNPNIPEDWRVWEKDDKIDFLPK